MERVFTAYSQRQKIAVGTLWFLLDDQRINNDQTPLELGLEENDQINCALEQEQEHEQRGD